MATWSRRNRDQLPEFRLNQHKQYLEYCQTGVEHKERERYIRMTTHSFHLNREVDSTAVLAGIPNYDDAKIRELERRLLQCNWLTLHNVLSEPLGYYCFCQHICAMYGMNSTDFWREVMDYDTWKSHRHARWLRRKAVVPKQAEAVHDEPSTSKRGRMGVLMGLEDSDSADSQYNEQLEERKIKRSQSQWAIEASEEEKHKEGSIMFGVPDAVVDSTTKQAYEIYRKEKKKPLVDFLVSKGYHEHHAGNTSFHQKTTCTEEKYAPSSTQPPTEEKSSTVLHASESHYQPSDAMENGPKDVVYRKLKDEEIPNFRNSEQYKTFMRHLFKQHELVEPEDFRIVKMLGQGGFGKVFCCKKIDSGKLYAVKCLSKARIIQKKAISMTKLEKDSMAQLRSNFIVGLDFACQDHENLYLVMTLMTGGNLRYHLRREGFGEHLSRFYAGQILLGLEHMHKLRILYRDLKLDNVLVDHRGHCRLSDLGLCGILPVGKQKTRYAGTPGYMAPEVVMRRPYNMSADIWSYGVCLYRMISGTKPFDGPNRHVLHKNVIAANPSYAKKFSDESKKLLQGLLCKAPMSRLGIMEIKQNKFFECLDWSLLQAGLIKPPFVPNHENLHAPTTTELCNAPFDKKKKKQQQQRQKEDKKAARRLEERYRHTFDDWDFVSTAAIQKEIVAALKINQKKLPDQIQSVPNSCCTII